MASQFDTGFVPFEAAEAIGQHELVYLSAAGKVSVCDLTNQPIGVATRAAALGEAVTVKLFNAPGTFKVKVSEALAAGAKLHTENSGKVQDTAQATSHPLPLMANEAATADGDIIEAIPFAYAGAAN